MATLGMDVVLSVPNRFRFHRQDRPPAVLFSFQLSNGFCAPMVGQQHSFGFVVCNSPVPTNATGHHHQGGDERSRRVDLLQGDVHM